VTQARPPYMRRKVKFMLRPIAVILALTVLGCPFISDSAAQQTAEKAIVVRGATTVANLIQTWIPEFEQRFPGTRIVVTASTHGEGFEALLNGAADLCMTARKLNAQELEKASSKGLRLAEEHLMNDAVAIVVNKSNPVGQLTLDQLTEAFSGDLSNWKQLGGPDENIQVIGLPESSGMASFLSKDILKRAFAGTTEIVKTPRDVPLYVKLRLGGLGFCRTDLALGASAQVKPLAVSKGAGFPAVQLSKEAVRDGSYPIMRPLGLCCNEANLKGPLKDFVEFCKEKAEQSVANRGKGTQVSLRMGQAGGR
jgi:phosphate transport system substrate-binding protein